ncbi:hypothetical protein JCM8547_000634 [Rhodosporidiobolus lusitaniae]
MSRAPSIASSRFLAPSSVSRVPPQVAHLPWSRRIATSPKSRTGATSASSASASAPLAFAKLELPSTLSRLDQQARQNLQRAGIIAAGGLVSLSALALALKPSEPDPIVDRPNPADDAILKTIPFSKLLNGYFVYGCVSIPFLVDISDSLLKFMSAVPGVSDGWRWFIRHTFFFQFLAGETTEEALPRIAELRARGCGTLLGYNIEALEGGAAKPESLIRSQLEETYNAIKTNGEFGAAHSSAKAFATGDTRSWVRIKLTGLIADPMVIWRASDAITAHRAAEGMDNVCYYPGAPVDGDWDHLFSKNSPLSIEDQEKVKGLYSIARDLMKAGQAHGVRVIVDAEQTWYQPLIDVATEELMREFNTGKNGPPVVVASLQAVLRRNSNLIKDQLERAKRFGYVFAWKQVRGAYHPYEMARWSAEKRSGPPPVWETKPETDKCYKESMELACAAIRNRIDNPSNAPDLAYIAATHNEISVDEGLELIAKYQLGQPLRDGSYMLSEDVANRFAFAQLYGMKDNLTNRIAGTLKSETGLPLVCKSMSYGNLDEALPFLARRAIENKSIMEGRGGASSERKRLGKEIVRRLLPWRE